MEDHEIPNKEPNPWHPMTKPIDIKHLGKLIEECGELASACGRALIQGIDECEPDSKKLNCTWIEDEIADVLANIVLVIDHFGLDTERMFKRRDAKIAKLEIWHNMLEV